MNTTNAEAEYYKLLGLKGTRPGPIVQDFRINRTNPQQEINQNPVQYLWADVFLGNTISAKITHERVPSLRVSFDHRGGWGCNLAIRPKCERACLNERNWKFLAFDARIPVVETAQDPSLLEQVGIALRLINGRLQHWEYALKTTDYLIFQVSDNEWGGDLVKVDLQDPSRWCLFPSDGNATPTAEPPDLSVIASVVLKFGSDPGNPGEPGRGKGIIDIREIYLTDAH